MEELWIETGNLGTCGKTCIAFSNKGRIKRKNGDIIVAKLKTHIQMNCRSHRLSRLVAQYFLIDCHKPEQMLVDHITHKPKEMNVNDVRNLRWCTSKENNNYEEAIINKSKVRINKSSSEFGRRYIEHFGYSSKVNIRQYSKEYEWFKRHGKCRWE